MPCIQLLFSRRFQRHYQADPIDGLHQNHIKNTQMFNIFYFMRQMFNGGLMYRSAYRSGNDCKNIPVGK